jgi:16S rRNA (cytosine967-C5)-methyltransferase
MDVQNLKIAYGVLNSIYKNKAYSNIVLNNALVVHKNCNSGLITSVVYGVLQKDIQLEYILNQCSTKPPKQSVGLIVKIGIYLLRFSKTPHYTIVNTCVKLSKLVHKNGVTSFVNAVLRKSQDVVLPKLTRQPHDLSINFSYPLWVIQRLISDYGIDLTLSFLSYQPSYLTHIRHNQFKITKQEFERLIDAGKNLSTSQSSLGFYVSGEQLRQLDNRLWTAQSLASMLVIEALGHNQKLNVLDLCSAPGGKAIYFLQNNPESLVTACDIHQHRLNLINSYAKRMGIDNIKLEKNDATVLNITWKTKFDIVMCDVPCSGLGLVHGKPDILLFKSESEIVDLVLIQSKILSNAAEYTKKGGRILYSTCTITLAENQDMIKNFLKEHSDFSLVSFENRYVKSTEDLTIQLWPHTHNTYGFFAAVLIKNQ